MSPEKDSFQKSSGDLALRAAPLTPGYCVTILHCVVLPDSVELCLNHVVFRLYESILEYLIKVQNH